jgi:nucleoside-diphosphate-sugar epimerase
MNILNIGGSGFLSGTITRAALAAGHTVTVITRGQRPLPPGVQAMVVDRKDRVAFANQIAAQPGDWDLVIDSIGMEPGDAEQDLQAFAGRCGAFVFISTDFVYDPSLRKVPQSEDDAFYTGQDYGARKRACEEVFLNGQPGRIPWTVLRPCHIYGPGSQLGCLPLHGRDKELISRLRAGETLKLVGGGEFLQQPIYAEDIAKVALAVPDFQPTVRGQIFNVAGPDIVPSREYYQIVADVLGVPLTVEAVDVAAHLAANPGAAPFCCDRVYDLAKLKTSGLPVPATRLSDGLRTHVEHLERSIANS